MSSRLFHRRDLIRLGLASAALGVAPYAARGNEEPIKLKWSDLIPGGDADETATGILFRVLEHGEAFQSVSVDLVPDYNGKQVSLPGYMVPLDWHPDGVRHFLLVPFIGACIHVPPPPPNQIVLVISETPYPARDYFDAVTVTGLFDESRLETDLAEIGYMIEASRVEAFES